MMQKLTKSMGMAAVAAAAVVVAVVLSLGPRVCAEASEPAPSVQVYEWVVNWGDMCQLSQLTPQDILAGASVEGLSYDSASNTLTLSNYNDPAAVIYILGLGDDLKIEIIGSNHIGCLVMYYYGAEITGSGTLVVGGNIGETFFNDDYYGLNNASGIEVGGYGDWEDSPNTQLIIGPDVSLQVYGPLDGTEYGTARIVVESSDFNNAIIVQGTLSATTSYTVWNADGWDAGVLQDETGVISISYDAAAANTVDAPDVSVDVSSLPTTSGAVAFEQEAYGALIDVIFANGIGYLTTAESNVYVVSIGVEGWELHFWANGVPVVTLGIVDAAGTPVSILQNMYLLNVDGAVYLNLDTPSIAEYALTDAASAALLKSAFGIDGIAINDRPITILAE